jgi:hypothetical protein
VLPDSHAKLETHPSSLQAQARTIAATLQREFDIVFVIFDSVTGAEVFPSGGITLSGLPRERAWVQELASDGAARVTPLGEGRYQLALPLYSGAKPILVALGEMTISACESKASHQPVVLQRWAQAVTDRLRLTDELAARQGMESIATSQATAPWEALLALDQLMRRLRLHKDPSLNNRRILEAAAALLPARGWSGYPYSLVNRS